MINEASRIRPASIRLLAGGVTVSSVPHTTRVGAAMAPRNGRLDQQAMAMECHSALATSGQARAPDSVIKLLSSRQVPSDDPTPHVVATSTKRFSLAG